MLQEIITYMIIGSAVTLAVMKIAKRFRKKKPVKVNFKKEEVSMAHNCTDCSAECVLRDMPKRIIETSSEVCKKVEIKSESL